MTWIDIIIGVCNNFDMDKDSIGEPIKKLQKAPAKRSIENLMRRSERPSKEDLLEAGLVNEDGKRIALRTATPSTLYNSQVHPRQAYVMAAQMGSTLEEIAAVFNVAVSTLSKWIQRFPEMASAVRNGRDAFNVSIIEKSLVKRALGYEYEEVCVRETSYKLKKEDGTEVVPIVEITRTKKQVAPDVAACIFYLKNRSSERWKDKQEIVNITSKDGKVVESLRNMPVAELKELRNAMRKALTSDPVQSEEIQEAEFEDMESVNEAG